MIDYLDLTKREEKMLGSIVLSGRSESVGHYVRREGFRGFLLIGTLIAMVIASLVAEIVWHRWLFEEKGYFLILAAFFVMDAILSPFRFRDEVTRTRLIHKLYRALEKSGKQGG